MADLTYNLSNVTYCSCAANQAQKVAPRLPEKPTDGLTDPKCKILRKGIEIKLSEASKGNAEPC